MVLILKDREVHKEQWRTGRFSPFPSFVAANQVCYLEVVMEDSHNFWQRGIARGRGFSAHALPSGRKQEHSGSFSFIRCSKTWMNAELVVVDSRGSNFWQRLCTLIKCR